MEKKSVDDGLEAVNSQPPDIPSDREALKYWCSADDNDLHEIRAIYKHRRRFHNFIAGEIDLNPRTIMWKLRQLNENKIKYQEWTVDEDRDLLEMYATDRISAARKFSEKFDHRSVMAVHRRRFFLHSLIDRLSELYPKGPNEAAGLPRIERQVPGIVSTECPWTEGRTLTADEENIAVEIVHLYGETDIKVDLALQQALGAKAKIVLDVLHAFANRPPATWTQAEDRILINGYNEHGDDWGAICSKLPRRISSAVEKRYKNLFRASVVASSSSTYSVLR